MRKDLNKLARVKSMEVSGERRLLSRGHCRDLEALPTHQSMRGGIPHYTYPRVVKFHSLANRWLEKQAGRPWDDVFSELKENFDTRTFRGTLTLEHVLNNIDIDVFLDNGIPKARSAWGQEWEVGGMYVHPETRKLEYHSRHENRANERRARLKKARALNNESRIVVAPKLQLQLDGNQWYWVELAEITPPQVVKHKPLISRITGAVLVEGFETIDYTTVCRDVLTRKTFPSLKASKWGYTEQSKKYGEACKNMYAKRKWQASRKDVAHYVTPTLLPMAA